MGTPSPRTVSTKRDRIAQLAQQMPGVALRTLAHYIDIAWLKEAHRRTRKDGAVGVRIGATNGLFGDTKSFRNVTYAQIGGAIAVGQQAGSKSDRLTGVSGPTPLLAGAVVLLSVLVGIALALTTIVLLIRRSRHAAWAAPATLLVAMGLIGAGIGMTQYARAQADAGLVTLSNTPSHILRHRREMYAETRYLVAGVLAASFPLLVGGICVWVAAAQARRRRREEESPDVAHSVPGGGGATGFAVAAATSFLAVGAVGASASLWLAPLPGPDLDPFDRRWDLLIARDEIQQGDLTSGCSHLDNVLGQGVSTELVDDLADLLAQCFDNQVAEAELFKAKPHLRELVRTAGDPAQRGKAEAALARVTEARNKEYEKGRARYAADALARASGHTPDGPGTRKAYEALQPLVEACYENARRSEPNLKGELLLALRIDADGSVKVGLHENEVAGTGLDVCVKQLYEKLTFAPSPMGAVIRIPMTFTPVNPSSSLP